MNKKVSVVIRNKNEAKALEKVLMILSTVYFQDIQEIIVVDNLSTDKSLRIAEKYGCKIVTIQDFSYGRAINLGMETATSHFVLLLSSHAIPVGSCFFKSAMIALENSSNIAGIRFINSIENYYRALENNFVVKEPLRFGLMAGCCLVNRKIWEQHKFNENLVFSEDKEWSARVVKAGYQILDLNETFFYFIKRDKKSLSNRYKNETISFYELNQKKFPSYLHIVGSFFKKIIWTNSLTYFNTINEDYQMLKTKFEIHNVLKKK